MKVALLIVGIILLLLMVGCALNAGKKDVCMAGKIMVSCDFPGSVKVYDHKEDK